MKNKGGMERVQFKVGDQGWLSGKWCLNKDLKEVRGEPCGGLGEESSKQGQL